MEGLDRSKRSAAFFGVRNGLGLFERFLARADGLGEPVLIELGRLRLPPARRNISDGLEGGFREGERRGGRAQGLEPICCRVAFLDLSLRWTKLCLM
jgi:hypothetical protein